MATNTSAANTPEFEEWSLRGLRTCFYMLQPQETYYQNVKDIPPLDVHALNPWGLILILIEIIFLKMVGKDREWRLHSAVVSFSSTAMYEAISICVLRKLELSIYQWTYDNMRFFTLPWDGLKTFVITLIGMDFGAYWWHRMSHEISIMWAAHELHHNSDDFNLSIAFRNSATLQLFRWIFYIPMAFFGVPTSIMLTHFVLGSIFNAIIHHNAVPHFKRVIPGLGHFVDFVFVTPSHHRVHHACNKYCIDKNYGQYSILWDRLFGTFAEERDDEELVFGSLTQPESYDMGVMHWSCYSKLWEKFKSMETFEDKLRALFYGPGWFPGTPRLGDPDQIPDVRGRPKYDPKYPHFVSLYLAANSACVFYAFLNLSTRAQQLSSGGKMLYLFYIFLGYFAIGGLYDKRSYAAGLELVRILSFILFTHLFPFLLPSLASQLVCYITYFDLVCWPLMARYNSETKEKVH